MWFNVRMKPLVFLFIATIAVRVFADETNAPAPLKIGTLEATNYYDKEMIVTGKVAQVTIRPTVTFMNLDQPFPNSPFTVVIFHGHSSFYGNANALKGKAIEIKGKIKSYHDKPEIALDNLSQLTVVGVTNLDLLLKPTGQTPGATPVKHAPVETNKIPDVM